MRALALLLAGLFCAGDALAAEMVQLDPFAQATSGYAGCPEIAPPLMTAEQAQTQAHARAERGTRCAMEGTCEPGGAYRRDPQILEKVRVAVAGDKRFDNTSVWITTSRKWVTLQGCVRSNSQRRDLVRLVSEQPSVERVFDELYVGKRR
jgi:osmotically-inducible protein OsmY